MWYVYLLKCSDGTIYTGCTQDIEKRLTRHGRGEVVYTASRLPVDLIGYTALSDKFKAYEYEKYLKSGSGIAFRNKRLI
ncbi:MAG: GIY-YIG nuclease family protein [Crocinitomicaceae bacterium]|nr:GIY-YIG nuclease family protein [Crocinitomicaceae bacterium]